MEKVELIKRKDLIISFEEFKNIIINSLNKEIEKWKEETKSGYAEKTI